MFCGKPEAVNHIQKERKDLELVRGQKGGGRVRQRDRGREADRERGTQGSFHGLPWRAGRAPIAAVQLGQKLAWDKERDGGKSTLPYVC